MIGLVRTVVRRRGCVDLALDRAFSLSEAGGTTSVTTICRVRLAVRVLAADVDRSEPPLTEPLFAEPFALGESLALVRPTLPALFAAPVSAIVVPVVPVAAASAALSALSAPSVMLSAASSTGFGSGTGADCLLRLPLENAERTENAIRPSIVGTASAGGIVQLRENLF